MFGFWQIEWTRIINIIIIIEFKGRKEEKKKEKKYFALIASSIENIAGKTSYVTVTFLTASFAAWSLVATTTPIIEPTQKTSWSPKTSSSITRGPILLLPLTSLDEIYAKNPLIFSASDISTFNTFAWAFVLKTNAPYPVFWVGKISSV